jgi:small subunit ribosomal protein S21
MQLILRACPGTNPMYNPKGDEAGRKKDDVIVRVIDQQLDKALRLLKRKLAKDGTWHELRTRTFYEKPSVKKRRRQRVVQRRLLKIERQIALG